MMPGRRFPLPRSIEETAAYIMRAGTGKHSPFVYYEEKFDRDLAPSCSSNYCGRSKSDLCRRPG
jgi:hypothetical protein